MIMNPLLLIMNIQSTTTNKNDKLYPVRQNNTSRKTTTASRNRCLRIQPYLLFLLLSIISMIDMKAMIMFHNSDGDGAIIQTVFGFTQQPQHSFVLRNCNPLRSLVIATPSTKRVRSLYIQNVNTRTTVTTNLKSKNVLSNPDETLFQEQQQIKKKSNNIRRRQLSYNQLQLNDKRPFPRTWIPLGSTYELNPNRPNEIYFLGLSYVIYQNVVNGEWIILDNVCSHRLAPLTEGRIESNGNIQCSYHGWTYNSTGDCIYIPQAAENYIPVSSCSVQTYPVKIHQNIIWSWLWSEDIIEYSTNQYNQLLVEQQQQTTKKTIIMNDNDEDHDTNNNNGIDNLMTNSNNNNHKLLLNIDEIVGDPTVVSTNVALYNCTTYTREVPYSYDILLENIVDPAHIPFAHHNLQGTRDDAIPINMTNPMNDGITYKGFTFTFQDRTMKMKRNGAGIFRAPYLIEYCGEYENMNDKTFNLTTLLIPTKPGWSKIIIFGSPQKQESTETTSLSETSASTTPKKPKSSLLGMIFKNLPIWFVHQLSNRFLDSDLAFLHYQEKERNRRRLYITKQQQQDNNENDIDLIQNYYFMPTQSDRSIVALRKWIQQYATYIIEESMEYYDTNKLVTSNKDILFDHYTQHTDQCKHCNHVYNQLKGPYRRNTYIVLCLSVLSIPIRKIQIVSCISIVICIALLQLYKIILDSLTRGEFKHYENN